VGYEGRGAIAPVRRKTRTPRTRPDVKVYTRGVCTGVYVGSNTTIILASESEWKVDLACSKFPEECKRRYRSYTSTVHGCGRLLDHKETRCTGCGKIFHQWKYDAQDDCALCRIASALERLLEMKEEGY